MAQTILSTLISPQGLRVVNDATGLEVFTGLKVKKVEIEPSAALADNPFMTGTTANETVVQDTTQADLRSGKVLDPVRMTISALSEDSIATGVLIQLFLDQTHTLTVTSKSIITSTMAIANIDITQDKDHLSTDVIEITLIQAVPASQKPPVPMQAADANAAGISTVVPTDLTTSVETLYNKILMQTGV